VKLSFQNLLMIAGGLLVLALLVWAFLPQAIDVDVGKVERGTLRVTVDHEGKTRVRERYLVSSPLSGRLQRVTLRPGDRVEASRTVLAVVEPADPALLDVRARTQAEKRVEGAIASRKQAVANLEKARTNHIQARKDLDRADRLLINRTISEHEYDNAVYREHATSAELRAAEFALQIAQFELEQAQAALLHARPRSPGEHEPYRFEIRAPVGGVVLRVFQESETVVEPGARLLEVGDTADLECEIDVLSADAVKIRPGARVLLEQWGGDRPLQGRVRVVERAAFTKISALGVEEQRVWVIVDLTDPVAARATLGDGYRVEARIIIWEGADVLKAPAGALFRRGEEWAVFAVAGGRAVLRPVKVGRSNGMETEILEGLDENEPVILHPSDRIKDGVSVKPR
jgi:HlyD family secretion protein